MILIAIRLDFGGNKLNFRVTCGTGYWTYNTRMEYVKQKPCINYKTIHFKFHIIGWELTVEIYDVIFS